MIKVSVMYPNTPGARFDHEYYRDQHMPMVKARMGNHCKYYTVDKGLAGGTPDAPATTSACATFFANQSKRFKPASARMPMKFWATSRITPTSRPSSRSAKLLLKEAD